MHATCTKDVFTSPPPSDLPASSACTNDKLSYCCAFKAQSMPKLAHKLQRERNLARFARQFAWGCSLGANINIITALWMHCNTNP